MRTLLAALVAASLSLAPAAHAAPPAAGVDSKKALYGVGLAVARSLEAFDLSPAELETVLQAVRDGASGKAKMPLDHTLQTSINDLARERSARAAEKAAARGREAAAKQKAEGPAYLARAAKEARARKTTSGAIVVPIREGSGASPKETDKVKVHYRDTLVDGSVFDSSLERGPAEFPLNQVVKCWTEALQLMKVGGKAKVVCPSEIAYGEQGRPPVIPGGAVLTFEVELLEIVK